MNDSEGQRFLHVIFSSLKSINAKICYQNWGRNRENSKSRIKKRIISYCDFKYSTKVELIKQHFLIFNTQKFLIVSYFGALTSLPKCKDTIYK